MSGPLKRRQFLSGAAWLGLGAALTGCGGGGSGPNSAGSLRVLSYHDADQAKVLRAQLARFTERAGVRVRLDTVPGSGAAVYTDKLRTQLLGGSAPDIWRIWGGEIGAPFARAEQAADLGAYYEKYGWEERLNTSTIADMTIEGTRYGVPESNVAMGAWYNRQTFQDAGVEEAPTTYAELEAANERLVEAGVVPLGTGGKYGWHIMRLFEYLLETTAGPELHDRLLEGETSWDHPAVVEAFRLFVKWQERGWIPKGALGLDPADVEPGFVQGKHAYTITTQSAEQNFIQAAGLDSADFGTFVLPTGHEPQRYSGFVEGYMIAASSPDKDDAAALLDFLLQPEVQQAMGIGNSAVVEAAPDEDTDPLAAKWSRIQQRAPHYVIQDQAFPKKLSDGYYRVQSNVLQGDITPREAAEEMATLVGQWKRSES